jgi:DNA-binding FadR family transcriptional regulator
MKKDPYGPASDRRTYPRRGLHGEVVHTIGARIVRGELAPRDPISGETEWADGELSRTALREAIKVLAAKGLVEMRPKTGTRVRERRFWNLLDPDVMAWRLEDARDARLLRDVVDLRRVIEPEAARLAAERAGDDEIADLRAAFEAMCAAGTDADAYLGPDLRFHAIILDACHNELLGQMATTLRRVLQVVFVIARNEAGYARATPLHEAILEAIAARDADAAEGATRRLIEDTAADLERALTRDTP